MINGERIERIRYMEAILNEAAGTLGRLSDAMDAYAGIQSRIWELERYYGGAEWLADCAADDAGELPEDLKRGVLSQDAVYDLLQENSRLRALVRQEKKTED